MSSIDDAPYGDIFEYFPPFFVQARIIRIDEVLEQHTVRIMIVVQVLARRDDLNPHNRRRLSQIKQFDFVPAQS
jgi:hypothetical protein